MRSVHLSNVKLAELCVFRRFLRDFKRMPIKIIMRIFMKRGKFRVKTKGDRKHAIYYAIAFQYFCEFKIYNWITKHNSKALEHSNNLKNTGYLIADKKHTCKTRRICTFLHMLYIQFFSTQPLTKDGWQDS